MSNILLAVDGSPKEESNPWVGSGLKINDSFETVPQPKPAKYSSSMDLVTIGEYLLQSRRKIN